MGGLSNGSIPEPHVRPDPTNRGVEKSPFQITAKWMEIDEHANRARLIRHLLALNLCIDQSYSFLSKPPNEWTQIERNMCGRRVHHCGDDLDPIDTAYFS